MKNLPLLIVMGLLVVAGLKAGAGQIPREGAEDTITTSQKGKPLASLIRPGQTRLIVEKDQSSPHYVEPPPGTSQLEWMTTLAPIVLLMRVEMLEPMLTPDADWVVTHVAGRVDEVLKDMTKTVSVGGIVMFEQDGGDIELGGVHVQARLPWSEGFRQDTRYLVFAKPSTNGSALEVDAGTAYQIAGPQEHLLPLARRGHARAEADVPLQSAFARIRAAANVRR